MGQTLGKGVPIKRYRKIGLPYYCPRDVGLLTPRVGNDGIVTPHSVVIDHCPRSDGQLSPI